MAHELPEFPSIPVRQLQNLQSLNQGKSTRLEKAIIAKLVNIQTDLNCRRDLVVRQSTSYNISSIIRFNYPTPLLGRFAY